MLKTKKIFVCDGCGKEEDPKDGTRCLPEGWSYSKVSEEVHFCKECSRKLGINGDCNLNLDPLDPIVYHPGHTSY